MGVLHHGLAYFYFVAYAFCVSYTEFSPDQYQSILPKFSSNSFIVIGLTVKFFTCYGER
jgi:hypothetical protein